MTANLGGFGGLAVLIIALFVWLRADMGRFGERMTALDGAVGAVGEQVSRLETGQGGLSERMARFEGTMDGLRAAVAGELARQTAA